MKCVHHNDCDGRSAGAIVAYFTSNYNSENYFEDDYSGKFPYETFQNGEQVFLVDYSFTEKTKYILDKMIENGCKIVHIDHHASSIELYEKYPEYKELDGIRSVENSGIALTWMYFTGVNDINKCPKFIQLISDFDCWHLKMDSSINFKYGIQSYDYGPLSNIWIKLIKEYYNKYNETVDKIVEKGKIIKKYCENINKEFCIENSFETEIEGHKCIALNRTGDGSLVFGDLINKYPMAMTFNFNGEYYNFSIYSEDKSIQCNKIAEKYGGGGHKGAAGFKLEDMPFKKI